MRKHCVTWLWLFSALLLLHLGQAEQQEDQHRIQRRFMWQEMDKNMMGGLMGRMFNGASAMRSMFGNLLPQISSTASYSNSMLDFMPTETTRVKYIIRNPHTHKPMKVIKMRGTKKVVKLVMPQHKHTTAKPESSQNKPNVNSYESRMRQLEKEQELIAEGKRPMLSDEAIMDKYFQHKPKNSNEIVSGKIMEYQSWKPVYKPGEQPHGFGTLRPQAMTQLHTNIAAGNHELLPKPEKLVSQDVLDDEVENELAKQMNHNYEVTEHTGEESAEVHVTLGVASMESGFVPSKYRSTTAAIAPRPRSRSSSTSTSTTTTTSTTEAPNYPASFLKTYREREHERAQERERERLNKSSKRHKPQPHYKYHADESSTASWTHVPASNVSFSMSTLRARLQEQQRQHKHSSSEQKHNQQQHHHQHQQHEQTDDDAELDDGDMDAVMVDAMHGGDKWPAEVQHSFVTIGPSAVAFDQPLELHYQLPKSSKYKTQRVNLRQRGSIKFGDKPSYDEM